MCWHSCRLVLTTRPAARYDHLNGLIDHHLLYNAAVRNGLDAGPDLEGYTAVARKKALGGRYYEVAFLEQLPLPSDADVRLAFARFKQPILARHLFYRTEGEVRAAYARLQSGRPFDDEAKDCFEVAGDDSLAGYLGEVRYFMVDDAVAEAAFALEVGAYSEPVRSRQGWHINSRRGSHGGPNPDRIGNSRRARLALRRACVTAGAGWRGTASFIPSWRPWTYRSMRTACRR